MDRLDRSRRALAIGLAGLAGFVDATGFLSAGGYFTSFMSGNTTRLGVDLASNPALASIPAGMIAGFVIGVAAGVIAAELAPARRKTAVLALVSGLLVIAAAARALWLPGFLAASVLAMGALNNVFRRNGEVAIGITYMTGALVRMGQGLAARILGRGDEGRIGAGLLWLGLAVGSVCGAAAFAIAPGVSPWLAAAYAALMLGAANSIERRSDTS